jgi:hypothetical protein
MVKWPCHPVNICLSLPTIRCPSDVKDFLSSCRITHAIPEAAIRPINWVHNSLIDRNPRGLHLFLDPAWLRSIWEYDVRLCVQILFTASTAYLCYFSYLHWLFEIMLNFSCQLYSYHFQPYMFKKVTNCAETDARSWLYPAFSSAFYILTFNEKRPRGW